MLVEEVVLDVPYLQSEVIHVLDLVQREQIELLGFAAVAVPTDPRKRITVRFVADRPRLCMQTLRSHGYTPAIRTALRLEEDTEPSLATALHQLADNALQLEAVYPTHAEGHRGFVVAPEDPDRALELLTVPSVLGPAGSP